jgi:hypothetical protein
LSSRTRHDQAGGICEIVKHMHGVTASYHQHYSTVRTTATSLVMPLGLVASITFLNSCGSAGMNPWWGIGLVAFVVTVTLYLNLVFTCWSRIARRCERAYEEEMLRFRDPGDGLPIGFRHRFRRVSGEEDWKSAMGDPIRLWQIENLRDPFMYGAALFSLLYLAGYVFAAGSVCTPG